MKKTAALFLLFIFLFNTVGYFIAFKAVQSEIKREAKTEISHDLINKKLTSITINKKKLVDIKWLESGKEMLYNNKLYDIVKTTETSSSITFYCINDTKEESLFANLEDHINTHIAANKPINSGNQKKVTDNVIKLYFPNEHSINFISSISAFQFFPANGTYLSTLIETDSPPPEFV